MKRILLIIMSVCMLVFLIGCGNTKEETTQTSGQPATTSESPKAGGKSLVVYFSVPETTNPDQSQMSKHEASSTVVIDGKVLGNTEYMATIIADATGADIFRLVPADPYPLNHQAIVDRAREEQTNDARPEYTGTVPDLKNYDTIFIGYPNWLKDMPMIVYTFIDKNDLSGKKIIPFGTHGGDGFSDTPGVIQHLEPNATVVQDGLMMHRDDLETGVDTIKNWLKNLGYVK